MNKIDWKRKLTSRKFWMAISSFVAMLVVAFGGSESQATQITAKNKEEAAVGAYTIGERLADASAAGTSGAEQPVEKPPEQM